MQSTKLLSYLVFHVILFGPVWTLKEIKLDFKSSLSAMKFIDRWLSGQKILINIILPDKSQSYTKDIVRLTEIILRESESNLYFIYKFKITGNKSIETGRKEIYWFPFQSNLYHNDVHCPYFIRPNETQQKLVLLYAEKGGIIDALFKFCKLRFDSNVLYYYKNGHADLAFEEIFKIHEWDENLIKNLLAMVNPESQKVIAKGLDSYIWKRRKNLHKMTFNSIFHISPPYLIGEKKSKNVKGYSVSEPIGYYADLLKYLMSHLNFTVNSTRSKKRNDYDFLIDSINKGQYDIGLCYFLFNRGRTDLVDFSFGISSGTYSWYYTENHNQPNFSAFVNSFEYETWIAISLYISTLIFGIFCLKWMLGQLDETSKLSKIGQYLKMAINFALRSIITKRMASEPNWVSTRIVFFVLTFVGFIFITLYRAMLVAFVAVDITAAPVNSLDYIRTSDYLLAIPKYTELDKNFVYAKPGSKEEILYRNHKLLRFENGFEFLDQMAAKRNKYRKVILCGVAEMIENYRGYYPCKLKKVKNYVYRATRAGIIFKKNWPFTRLLNHYLLKMREKGILDRYFHPYAKTTKETCGTKVKILSELNAPHPASLYTTVFIFLIISGGLLCAATFYVIELVVSKTANGND